MNKILISGILSLCLCFVSACGTHPTSNEVYLYFGADTGVFDSMLNAAISSNSNITVYTENLSADTTSKATNAKLFLGTRQFSGHLLDNGLEGKHYSFTAGRRCDSIFSGGNLAFHYEIYDSTGSVIQQNTVMVANLQPC